MRRFESGVKIFRSRFGENVETININSLETMKRHLEGFNYPLYSDSTYHLAISELLVLKLARNKKKLARITREIKDSYYNWRDVAIFIMALTFASFSKEEETLETRQLATGETFETSNKKLSKLQNFAIQTGVVCSKERSSMLQWREREIRHLKNCYTTKDNREFLNSPASRQFVANQYDSEISASERKTPLMSYHRSQHNSKRVALYNTSETRNRIIDSLNRCNNSGQKKLTQQYVDALTSYLKKSEIPTNYETCYSSRQFHAVATGYKENYLLDHRQLLTKKEREKNEKISTFIHNGAVTTMKLKKASLKDYSLTYNDSYNEFERVDLNEISQYSITRKQVVSCCPTNRMLKVWDQGETGEKIANLKNRKFIEKKLIRSSNEPITAKLDVTTFYNQAGETIQQFDVFYLLGFQVIRTYQRQTGLDLAGVEFELKPFATGICCKWISPEDKKILREKNAIKAGIKGFNKPKKTAREKAKKITTTIKTKTGEKKLIELPDKRVSDQKRNSQTGILFDQKTAKLSPEAIDANKWLQVKLARLAILASKERVEVSALR
jgi:hypothetical protein